MTLPIEPEDVGFWSKVAGATAGVFAALFGVWKHTHRRIDSAFEEIGKKASLEEMNRQRDNIAGLFRQQREDREAVMAEFRNTNELLGQIHVAVTRELGVRPTREEVARMITNTRKGDK